MSRSPGTVVFPTTSASGAYLYATWAKTAIRVFAPLADGGEVHVRSFDAHDRQLPTLATVENEGGWSWTAS